MPTTANVSTGKPKVAGAVYVAPKGTTLPTDASTTLASTFKDLGYISEDGVTNANSPDTEKIKAWGGQIVLTVTTEKSDTFQMTFIESLNTDVLKTIYGAANVTIGTSTISIVANASELDEAVFVIDTVMRGGALKRIVIPCGKVGELGDVVYKDDEPIGYQATIEAMPDSSGNNHYEYIQLPTT